jgi:hypothetical protein
VNVIQQQDVNDAFRRMLASMVGESSGLQRAEVNLDGEAMVIRQGAAGRIFEFLLGNEAVTAFTDGHLDDDVRALWGPGIPSTEGAARIASVHVEEIVTGTMGEGWPEDRPLPVWSLSPHGFVASVT